MLFFIHLKYVTICDDFMFIYHHVHLQVFSFEILEDLSMDVRLKTPANFYISGQSQCGKSYLVRSICMAI